MVAVERFQAKTLIDVCRLSVCVRLTFFLSSREKGGFVSVLIRNQDTIVE